MVHCREDFAGAAALSVVALCLRGTVQAQHVTTWTTRPVSHLQLSRWFFFASPAQVNGHFGFWSILGVLSGIGALIIGITYLICRFKKPTNQVADRDLNMVEDNFVHANVRTVLYPDNHMEHQYLQPAPVVRLESNRPPSYGAAAHRPYPSAVAMSTVPGASTSTSMPLITTPTSTLGKCSQHNQLCSESWIEMGTHEISNTDGTRRQKLGTRKENDIFECKHPNFGALEIKRTLRRSQCPRFDSPTTGNTKMNEVEGHHTREREDNIRKQALGSHAEETKNIQESQLNHIYHNKNELQPVESKSPPLTSRIARSIVKLTCASNFLSVKRKLTGVSL